MKLGLLVALAVAAVVAGLSDGRNVTECELRQTLASAIVLPSFLQRYKENILAAVICKVKLMSQLDSGLVTVKGTCTTTPEPTTPEPTTPEPTTPEPTTPEPTTPEPTTPDPTTPEPTTPEPTTPDPTTPEPTTPEPTTPTTPEPTTPTTPEPTTPQPTTPQPTTTASITVGNRRKRALQINTEESNKLDKVLIQIVQTGRVNLFNEDDYNQCNRLGPRGDSHEDDSHKDDSHKDDSHEDDSHEDDSHEEENGKGDRTRPSCLGFYGLFQLSDGYFCDSGYRPSKNVCGTNCTAFADDNIVDDIACLVNTNYWWYLLENTPRFCFNSAALVSTCGV